MHLLQSEGADPTIRSDEYDPYLKPGRHLPVDVALEEPELRKKILALEAKYKDTPKARALGKPPFRAPPLRSVARVLSSRPVCRFMRKPKASRVILC